MRAEEHGFDPFAALARDELRFQSAPGPVWGLARERLPEVLVVARIANSGGRHPLDRFIGLPTQPWKNPGTVDLLLRGAGTIVDQEVVTAFGEVVRADLTGVIYPHVLDRAPEARSGGDPAVSTGWQILKEYLAPRRAITSVTPELFTWSSAFNTARDAWPGVSGLEQLERLTPEQQGTIANHFLGYGLEALAAESEHMAIRMAARRLVELCDRGFIELHLTAQPHEALQDLTGQTGQAARSLLPEEHGLVYLRSPQADPGAGEPAQKRTLLVPLQWIAAALQREVVALVHLARVASLARDDSFGKLSGNVFGFSRTLRLTVETPLFDVAIARADSLAARFLDEALRFDTRIYGLQVQRDDYCRAIERQTHRVGQYPDPTVRR
jgi:hypothetical protein